ncbi:MAG: sugar phosphate isomerase/epimerase family protein [Acutalibacteraceae bacterium]
MEIGVSSSCFYPLETEIALEKLGKLGVKTAEVFFNSPSETESGFVKELCKIKNYYGINIVSFHPFMSFAEGYYIFSDYERRFKDSLEMYKPMFEAAAQIGAKFFVLHGAKDIRPIPDEEYANRFYIFSQTAKQFGITTAHENVVGYVGQTPQFMAKMKRLLEDDFKMVLDIKQARRAKQNPFDFIDAVGKNIIHLHLSDCSQTEDCLPPYKGGLTDFSALFQKVLEAGICADGVVEVYKNNYTDEIQLKEAMEYLQMLCRS